jgi:eukaryotic-like serine/threonine-protein kinase
VEGTPRGGGGEARIEPARSAGGASLSTVAAGALLDRRYRVGPMIARGGMSTVHRGLDTRLDRPVAIKVMDPRLAGDPAFRTRFEREARSAARIDHPAVVDVHDQGRGDPDGYGREPVLFLVMELVEGGTLRDVLRARGALGVPAALAVMEPVLAGLAEAHRLGLVHRDVKPENVLISRAGEVKVADFGLVTAAAQAGASHVGMILGTVAYLSPEQVATGAADTRSDVYAAGVLLYELLTGEPPYTGDTPLSVAYRHVNDDVPAPSLIAGDVPPELDELVRTATRRDPAARPADAAALLEALREVRDRLGVPRVPPPLPPGRPVEEQDTVPAGAHRAAGVGTGGAAGPNGTAVGPGPGGTRALTRSAATGAHRGAGDRDPAPVDGVPPHVAARRRSRRLFALVVAVVVVLALLVAVSAWWLGTGRWTAMPSVVGIDRAVAERLLAEADLVARVSETHDDAVGAGLVAATDPTASTRLLRGSEVRLTVSSGRPVVPAIAPGTGVAAAEQAVRDAGLTPVRAVDADEFSASVPEGAVVRTRPGAGAALPIGGPVTLVLSRGVEPPREIAMPFLIGEDAKDAVDELVDAGLQVEIEAQFPFGSEDGTVVGQDPGPGARVPPGSTVVLTTL